MKIAVFSDGHGYLPDVDPCDLILIGGDNIPLSFQDSADDSFEWYNTTFRQWGERQDCKKIIFIAGNHDLDIEARSALYKDTFPKNNKITYIEHEAIDFECGDDKVTIFGTPLCHRLYKWAFMYDDDKLEKFYEDIPENVDILLSHDSPNLCGLGDIREEVPIRAHGSYPLAEAILTKKPKVVFSGHIHSGDHIPHIFNNIYMVNVSLLNEDYNLAHSPFIMHRVFNYNRRKK